MGEIEKILGLVEFEDNPCEYLQIEFNKGGAVHLQTNCWRIEVTPEEFSHFAKVLKEASRKLVSIKRR